MAGSLPEPVLLSKIFHLDKVVIHGHSIEFRHVFYTWLVMIILFVVSFFVRRGLTLVPNRAQNFFEAVIDGFEEFTVANMGEEGHKIFHVLMSIFIFVLAQNLIGLVPGCDAPTANINTNVGMAIFIFCYYNYKGIKRWGAHYIQHFMGPAAYLAPLMIPLELISHLARPLSLTLRLFGNIRGEEIVMVLFFLMAPIVGTVPVYFLFFLAKVMQAFIVYMLAMIYLKGALEPAH